MTGALSIKAGPEALQQIRRDGFDEDYVRVVPAASGAAKWLSIARLDEVILTHMFQNRHAPLHMVGSSIGSVRVSYWARKDPVSVLRAFEETYINYNYEEGDGIRETTDKSFNMMHPVLNPEGIDEILSHPFKRVHIMAVRGRGLTATAHPTWVMPGFFLSFVGNLFSRQSLRFFFERALFSDPRDVAPFAAGLAAELPTQVYPLNADIYERAVIASGTIPRLIEPVVDIPGAPRGPYWDGGITDYHWDIPFFDASENKSSETKDLIFYPHFYETIIPGWFDKNIGRTANDSSNLSRLILISPSREFVSTLPFGKIPDRGDFTALSNQDRMSYWRTVLNETKRVADEFYDVLSKDTWAEVAEPL